MVLQATRWMVFLGTTLLSASAIAQTADGIGERTDAPEDVGAEAAADQVEDLIDNLEYQPRFYQVSARTWFIYTPSFFLDGSFSLHTNMWEDGVANLAYGLEFTTRIPDKFDVVVGLDWANLRTADGYWLEDGDPVVDADYTESNLSLINADVSLHWFTNLNRKENFQWYYGFGLGMGVVLGELTKYDIDPGTSGCNWTQEERDSQRLDLVDECASDFDNPYIDRSQPEDRIPPVVPALSLTTGLRYMPTDNLSIGIETGFKTLYFYGGLEIGYYWNQLR